MAKKLTAVTSVINTKRQQRFIDAFCRNGYNRELAEKSAGLSSRSGYNILAKPEVQALIIQHQESKLVGELYPMALAKFKQALDPKSKFPHNTQITAAKAVTEAVGKLVDARNADPDGTHKTPEQIAAQISKLEEHAANLAKPIEDAEIVEDDGIFD